MSYDPDLAEVLSGCPTEIYKGHVFRATRANADPTAPSLYGGRWARPQNADPGTNVLYTSMDRDGALAEVVAFLVDQVPIPKPRLIKVTRLNITASKVLRLQRSTLESLGVEMTHYGERDYGRTQEIGSTLAWLGIDALIAPSARWNCENLMIFTDNHNLGEKLEPINAEQIEWQEWARRNGFLENLL
jgi:hypothetical protein